eukprot:1146391-Pelagomonas_calceolata.AAC.1
MHLSLHTCKQSIHSCIPKCAWTCPQTQITDKLPQRALSLFKRKFTYVRHKTSFCFYVWHEGGCKTAEAQTSFCLNSWDEQGHSWHGEGCMTAETQASFCLHFWHEQGHLWHEEGCKAASWCGSERGSQARLKNRYTRSLLILGGGQHVSGPAVRFACQC